MLPNDHGYIKALSLKNCAELVYAWQVFSEPGMPPGLHLTLMYDNVIAIPDSGWIIWHDMGGGEPAHEVLTDDEFRSRFTPYDQLPETMRAVCDAHPGYDEWCAIKDRQFDAAQEGADGPLVNARAALARVKE